MKFIYLALLLTILLIPLTSNNIGTCILTQLATCQ